MTATPSLYLAKSVRTGLFYVQGRGFIGKRHDATKLTSTGIAVIRYCFGYPKIGDGIRIYNS